MDISEKGIMPEEGFVRLPVVLRVLGISRTALYNGIARGDYPKPVDWGHACRSGGSRKYES